MMINWNWDGDVHKNAIKANIVVTCCNHHVIPESYALRVGPPIIKQAPCTGPLLDLAFETFECAASASAKAFTAFEPPFVQALLSLKETQSETSHKSTRKCQLTCSFPAGPFLQQLSGAIPTFESGTKTSPWD